MRTAREGPRTILISGEDATLAELRPLLEQEGYRVLHAGDGLQTRQMVYRDSPDLVILDLAVSGSGGIPILEHFRGKPEAPPMIVLGASPGGRYRAYAEYLGAAGYLPRALARDRLLESVRKSLAGRDSVSA